MNHFHFQKSDIPFCSCRAQIRGHENINETIPHNIIGIVRQVLHTQYAWKIAAYALGHEHASVNGKCKIYTVKQIEVPRDFLLHTCI